MCEVALPAISETAATWYAAFAFLFHSAAAVTSARNRVISESVFQVTRPFSSATTYARTALLRFSSATRGRFCCCAGVEVESSMTGGVNAAVGGAWSAEEERRRRDQMGSRGQKRQL